MAFNWDCLDIGNVELEHSQNYFDIRHIEHERLGEQCEEFIEKMVPHSKPIAIFKGKRLFKSNEFEDQTPAKKKLKAEMKKIPMRSHRISDPRYVREKTKPEVVKIKPKLPVPTKKKDSLPSRLSSKIPVKPPVKPPTVTRTSRLIQHAEAYAAKRRAMLERHRKEQEEKNKPTKFRARSLPKFIKEQTKAKKRRSTEGNKENHEEEEPRSKRHRKS